MPEFIVLFLITTDGFKVSEGRFRFHKSKLHQEAGCIVNLEYCSTGGRKVIELVMAATIKLE